MSNNMITTGTPEDEAVGTDTPEYATVVAELGDPAAPLAALNEAMETISLPQFDAI